MSTDSTPLRILVIDDDRDLAESLGEYLELDGHSVRVEFNATDGLGAVEEESFDHVILDVGLPGTDGIDVMRAIESKRPGLRIILITGHSAVDVEGRVAPDEAIKVITKPVDPEELSRRLRE